MNIDNEANFTAKKEVYNRLGVNIKLNLEFLLDKNNVEYAEICYRIKEYKSFLEKVSKEKYNNSMEKIEDICGIRIVCFYVTDLSKINQIISNNFDVISSEYKEQKMNNDQFGYRSNHYIVKLKKEWLIAPIYEELKELKAEIQVRTTLMNVWADISHKLNYKQDEKTTDKLKRKLNQLSALFEIADERFVNLKSLKIEEAISTLEEESSNDILKEDEDTLMLIAKKYIKRESNNKKVYLGLLKEMKNTKVSFDKLINLLKIIKDEDVKEIENYIGKKQNEYFVFSEIGYIRTILKIGDKSYRDSYRDGNDDDDKKALYIKIRQKYKL